jgi:cytochrome b561
MSGPAGPEKVAAGGVMNGILVFRYHPLLVVLHWTLAVLIIAMLCAGFLVLAPMQNPDPHKIGLLMIHMAGGMIILGLMVVRIILLVFTAKPAKATAGNAVLDRIRPLVHTGFYLLVVLMAGSGLATSILAGLNRSVFQGTGEPLPTSFEPYPTFAAHFYLALLLTALIALHVLAALYHQFARRDGLLQRMWFGRRRPLLPTVK